MVVSLALGTELGVDGAVAHVFGNILYKGTLFMCAGVILAATGKRKITEMGGLARELPVTAVCMGIASLAICGFPLFSGFVSKGLIMNAIAESGRPLTEILMLIASVGTLLSVGLEAQLLCVLRGTASSGSCPYDRGTSAYALPLSYGQLPLDAVPRKTQSN